MKKSYLLYIIILFPLLTGVAQNVVSLDGNRIIKPINKKMVKSDYTTQLLGGVIYKQALNELKINRIIRKNNKALLQNHKNII